MKKFTSALFLLFLNFGFSQENKTLNDSLFSVALQLRNDGKYQESITELDKISRFSSDNSKRNIEKARVLFYDNKNDFAIELLNSIDKASLDLEDLHNYYLIYGNVLDNSDKKDQALSLYNEALTKFPNSYLIYYNRAVIYSRLNKQQEAYNDLLSSLNIYPNFYRTHYLLGLIAFKSGNLSEGVLAMTTSIVLDFSGNNTESTIKTLNYYLSKKQEETENKFEIPGHEVFEATDNILKKQYALNTSYKLQSPIDITYIRQLQALLSELQKIKQKKGFYAERYVDFYDKIWQNKSFEAFTYKLFLSYDSQEMQKIILKKSKEIEKFNEWMFTNITKTICTKTIENDAKKEIVSVIDEDGYIGYGNLVNDKKEGLWLFTYADGNKYLEGKMKENKFDGEIQFYYRDGKKSKTIHYNSGLANGKATFYYSNGNKLSEREFLNGNENNKQTFFFRLGGGLKSYYSFSNGKIDGKEEFFYNDGTLKSTITFANGEIASDYQEFFPNGALKTKTENKKGKINGVKKEFYPDGVVFNTENYVEGNLTGENIKNFQNGDVFSIHKIENNKLSYYKEMQGKKLNQERFYSGDRLVKQILYTRGKPIIEYLYEGKDGYEHLSSYKQYDQTGKLFKEIKIKVNEPFIIKLYNNNYLLEGKYNAKGQKTGEWKYYNLYTGLLDSHTFYNENVQTDKYEDFYTNGKLKTSYAIKDGVKDGKYISYYKNGQIESESYYINDEQNGEVKGYYKNGTLKSIYFVVGNNADGIMEKYNQNGKIQERTTYWKDDIQKSIFFNNDVPVSEVDYLKNGVVKFFKKNTAETTECSIINGAFNGKYSIKNDKNQKIFEANIQNGQKFGAAILYNPNNSIAVTYNNLNNQIYGVYVKNNLEGKLYWKANYFNDIEFGLTEKYFHEGFKYMDTEHYNDQKNGEEKYYGSNGEEIIKLFFEEDILIAYQKNNEPETMVKNGTAFIQANYKNGKPALEINYKNGLLDGAFQLYADNGTKIIHADYAEGELIKRQINYLTGKPYATENFENNDYNGKTTYFYPDGKIKIEANYVNDVFHGLYREYDTNGKLILEKKYEDDVLVENK